MRFRKDINFISCFNERTGEYIRSGIIVDGKETVEEPFMSSFPELLDVGIMGHCMHGRSGLCLAAGVECYQDGMHRNDENMSIEDFRRIAEECRGRTYQFALGGCGDPDQHECFEEILKVCERNQIVPNFTTSGIGMTMDIAKICKRYCGAVAVSWYRNVYTINAIKMLVKSGVKTNIHYVLHNESLEEAINLLRNKAFPNGINAVIFLLHKPVGLGSRDKVISIQNEKFTEFLDCVLNEKFEFKIGFDSCSVPALINCNNIFDVESLDTCEGARWSAYISADMKMMPCSFDNQEQKWAVDLRTHTIQEVWNSAEFEAFREHLRKICPNCDKRGTCMGGCPIRPEIVLCNRREAIEDEPYNTLYVTTYGNTKKVVVIPQVIFKGKRNVPWDDVEKYIVRYIGKIFEVAETEDIIEIDKSFVDEYTGSEYTRKLIGALPKVKANMSQGIPQMIEIATGKRWQKDFDNKHGKKAINGWYRYNTRFALPITNVDGEIEEYNIFQAVLIVRYSVDGKLYLYDIQNIKKETRYPSWTELSNG